jgi:hypothetical protein
MLSELASSLYRTLVLIGSIYLLVAVALALAACIATFFVGRIVHKFVQCHGRRRVFCPETGDVAIVRIDALHAAVSSAIGDPELRVLDCSRWPERRDCGQECRLATTH